MQTFTPRPRGGEEARHLLDPVPDKAAIAELAQKLAEIDAAAHQAELPAPVTLPCAQSLDPNAAFLQGPANAPFHLRSSGAQIRSRLLSGVAQTVLIANIAIALALVLDGFTGWQLEDLPVQTVDLPEEDIDADLEADLPVQTETAQSEVDPLAADQGDREVVHGEDPIADLLPDDYLTAQAASNGSGSSASSASLIGDPYWPELLAYLEDLEDAEQAESDSSEAVQADVADTLVADVAAAEETQTDPVVRLRSLATGPELETHDSPVDLASDLAEDRLRVRDDRRPFDGLPPIKQTADSLLGQDGANLLFGTQGVDMLDGGAGEDWVIYARSKHAVHVDLSDARPETGGDAEGDRLTGIDHVVGSNLADTIRGDHRDNILVGLDGDDVLAGGDGGDRLEGGSGNDLLSGGNGHDSLAGGDGADRLSGGRGNDTISGDADNDLIHGGQGEDTLHGGDGNDRLYSEKGHDTLHGNGGNDVLYGGKNADTLFGDAGNDRLYGEYGHDTLFGGEGADVLYGGRDRDALHGGHGNDRLYGEYGSDLLTGGEGDDRLFGGRDQDRLYGGTGNDVLNGERGRDTLYGGQGDDELNGGAQADKLYGEWGNDRLSGGEGQDKLYGGTGDDHLFGRSGDDRLTGGAGDDYLAGGWGQDTFVFREGFGSDVIEDFKSGWDRLLFDGYDGVGYRDLELAETDMGVRVTLDDDSVVLSSISLDRLSEADFLFT